MYTTKAVLLLSLFEAACILDCGAHQASNAYQSSERVAQVRAMYDAAGGLDKLNAPVCFYGKVVDQSGAPVLGAEVSITFYAYAINEGGEVMSDKILKTDSNGLFVLSHVKGKELVVNTIQGQGYEFPYHGGSPEGSHFEYAGVSHPYVPNQAHPVVFFGRKKGPGDCLLTQYISIGFSPSDASVIGEDLILGAQLPFQPSDVITQLGGDPVVWDLKIQASFDATKRFWSLRLTSDSQDSGIFVSDKILYEAPAEGYKSSWMLGPNAPKAGGRYVYLRSRKPYIYARIDFGESFSVKKWPFVDDRFSQQKWDFSINGRAVVNPFGDRNLENDTELPFDVRHQIQTEIDSAFRHGNRPTKPDLSALVDKWRIEHPKLPGK